MLLLNCKITSWYYYLIFYYNKDRRNCNVSQKVLNLAQNVEILYYDPLNKIFFNKEKKPMEILEKSRDSNLDLVNIDLNKTLLNLNILKRNYYIFDKDENLEKAFKNDLGFLVPNNQNKNVYDIIQLILDIMEIKAGRYNLIKKIDDLPDVVMFPSYTMIMNLYSKNID